MSVASKAGARRRVLSWPVFGLTLGALVAGSGAARAAGPVLPTGGRVAAGQAVIGAPGGGVLTVTQSSSKAILDWNGFSIGAGGKVAFDNGAGATLNRVTGGSASSLDGLLTGTGSVYLINPNGVIVGRNGVVKVGGSFVASTLDTSDAGFLAGGALSFAGASTASVVNLGKVGSLGGDVALIAAEVSNAGALLAPQGSAGLIAGHSVLMLRDGSLDQGRFSVLLGGAGMRASNSGLISAADAELRAEGGNVYALAGDTAGVIRATGVKRGGGKVWLVAQGGELDLAGAIDAQAAGGTPGSVETSGGTVKIGSARIDAHGGRWLVDPYDLTIDATAATTIDNALNAGTSVTEQTTASGYSGAGVASASGKGDITVAAPISWSTNAGLTLSAYRNIDVNASITSSGGGAATLYADNTGTGTGTVSFGSGGALSTSGAISIFYNPPSNPAGNGVNTTSYTNPTNYSAYVEGGGTLTSYMLVNTVYDLQNMQNNLSGAYALGRNIDASATANGLAFLPIGVIAYNQDNSVNQTQAFQGLLEGQGHTISGLTINMPHLINVGLFGGLGASGTLRDFTLTGGAITGADYVGALAGVSLGAIANVAANVPVTGVDYTGQGSDGELVGGLIGMNAGTINLSSASGAVTGYAFVGGLAGDNDGTYGVGIIQNSHASGAVTELGGATAGGLVGGNYGAGATTPMLINVYATGAVVGTGIDGGLAGDVGSGVITRSYATGAVSVSGDSPGQPFNGEAAGGLIGYVNRGHDVTISEDYASGAVSGFYLVGGLIGEIAAPRSQVNYLGSDSIRDVYAAGTINSSHGPAGGLIGSIDATPSSTVGPTNSNTSIHNVYSSVNSQFLSGGLVGSDDGPVTITNGYFDATLAGQTYDTAGGVGLTTAQFRNATSPISGLGLGVTPGGSGFVIVDSDGTLNGSNGATRPILLSEYSTTVTNAHQLQLVALNLSATYTLAANIDAGGTSDPSDVWGPAGFVPVGQASTPFTGMLNGSGHTVSGLSIAEPGATDVGLFGAQSGAIGNVIVSGVVTGGTAVGTLVGYNTGTVSGASGKGTVSGSSQVGGLLGYNSGAVSGSYGKAAVSSPSSAGSQMGGLAGFNSGQLSADYATGKVTGNTQLGGLVGLNAGPGTLTGDYATGAVNGASGKTAAGSGSAIGGLVGQDTGEISSSHATGAVTGYSQVGGLAGYTDGAQVLSSYATGAVSGASGQNTPSGSGAMVGGLIGESSQFMGISDSYATGAVSGVSQVGGLIGSHDGSGALEQSYATGAVKGSSQVGGLVGYNNNEIVNSYATGAVSGSSGKGALVGVNDQQGSVIHSYATGKAAFGLVGVNNGPGMGELYQDYFDAGTTGTTTGVGSGPSAGVTAIGGSTGLDPHQASSYTGFDFANTWTIQAGASRPYLLAVPQSPPPT